jgi:hypothetical protein
MLRHLLRRGASLEGLAQGRTALGWAACAGKTAAVRALAEAGANLLAEDTTDGELVGLLSRQLAEYHGHTGTAEALSEVRVRAGFGSERVELLAAGSAGVLTRPPGCRSTAQTLLKGATSSRFHSLSV